jgi:NADH-quinone oxidoreductase E subunit
MMAVELSAETQKKCEEIMARYPEGWKEAAILPVLHLVQREWGYVSLEGLKHVADMLGMPAARAAGVMSFYPMFHKAPVGRHVIQICSTLSCALCGAEEVVDFLKEKLKIEVGETTQDGRFTLEKVECIAACEGGPAIRINDALHRYLTKEKLDKMLDQLD